MSTIPEYWRDAGLGVTVTFVLRAAPSACAAGSLMNALFSDSGCGRPGLTWLTSGKINLLPRRFKVGSAAILILPNFKVRRRTCRPWRIRVTGEGLEPHGIQIRMIGHRE